MTRLVVVEARRLLPIFMLFIMLIAVSIYDGISSPTSPVTTQPNPVPYQTLNHSAQGKDKQLEVVTDLEMWVAMHRALGIQLSNYDFDPETEVAVFLLNCQLRSTTERDNAVELSVTANKDTYQLVMFSKASLPKNAEFVLVDSK